MTDQTTSTSHARPITARPLRGLAMRAVLILVGSVAAAFLILVIAWNLDAPDRDAGRSRLGDVTELVPPDPLTDEEATAATSGVIGASTDMPEGAWVEVAGPDGELEQRYSAARIDPLPDGMLSMESPRAVIFLSGGRIATIAGGSALARVPSRALESGTLRDDVVIRLFDAKPGRAIDPATDEPAMVVRTDLADFDRQLGEIRCPERIRVDTREAAFEGEDLVMVLDERDSGVERLTIERPLGPVRVFRRANDRGAGSSDDPGAADPGTAGASDASVPSEDGVGPRFHRLTLERSVRIERHAGVVEGEPGDDPLGFIEGDRLLAFFSLDEASLDGTGAPRSPGADAVGLLGGDAASIIAPLAFAQATPPNQTTPQRSTGFAPFGRGDVTETMLVHYEGRLELAPVTADEATLTRADDLYVLIDGEEVTLADGATDARAVCAKATWRSLDDVIELHAHADQMLTVESPRFDVEAERFTFRPRAGTGRLDGRGRIRVRDEAGAASAIRGAVGVAPQRLRAMVAGAASSGVGSAWHAARHQDDVDGAVAAGEPPLALEIEWEGGVDLAFAEDADTIESAIFDGDVRVGADDFRMSADRLRVEFDVVDAAREAISRILATGSVLARRLVEDSALGADQIDLSMTRDDDGNTIPEVLIARGGVDARDRGQRLWTEALRVHFLPRAGGEPENAGEPEGAREGGLLGGSDGNVDIGEVVATNGVQVLLPDGSRVWAHRLDGDGVARRLRLTGTDRDVVLGKDNVIADRLSEVAFDEARGEARVNGPGRFRFFDAPVVPVDDGPVPAPRTISRRVELDATWREELRVEERPDDASAIELRGDVVVRNRPNAREENDLESQTLLLDLRPVAPSVADLGEPGSSDPASPASSFGRGVDLRKVTAKGAARLESRTWPSDARIGEPELVRIDGEHVEYELDTREGAVFGQGALLVNRLPEAGAAETGPGAVGTTRFAWSRTMTMRNVGGDRFRIVMENDVEVLHAGLAEDETFSLTGRRLEVWMDRPRSEGTPLAGARTSVDLGGSAKLLRIRGEGRIVVRTPDQDVTCDGFDYDAETEIATLDAAPGNLVIVQPRGSGTPVRAKSVVWDLRSGRIQVSGARGSVSGG